MNLTDVRSIIENLLEQEEELLVLRKAAEALGQIGTPDSIMVERQIRQGS